LFYPPRLQRGVIGQSFVTIKITFDEIVISKTYEFVGLK